jgi:hypothetical protein
MMATSIWNGGIQAYYSDPTNWIPNSVPGAGDTAVVDFGNLLIDENTTDVTFEVGMSSNAGGFREITLDAILDSRSSIIVGAQGATISGLGSNLGTISVSEGELQTDLQGLGIAGILENDGTLSATNNGVMGFYFERGTSTAQSLIEATNQGTISIGAGINRGGPPGSLEFDGSLLSSGPASTLSFSDLSGFTGVEGTITGSGKAVISDGGTIETRGIVASGLTFQFADGSEDMLNIRTQAYLFSPNWFSATIENFAPGDTIVSFADSYLADAARWSDGVLSLTSDGSVIQTLTMTSTTIDYSTAVFSLSTNATDELTTITVSCFAAGTRIRTEQGDVLVERLKVGDKVLTRSGSLPVQWIGHRRVECRAHPEAYKVMPVRVSAHAFGVDLPSRALYLSPDHAVSMERVLIPVKHLINGTTIRQVKVDTITYYHVELEHHEVILAEGLPCESYLDTGDRTSFSGGTTTRVYPVWGFEAQDVTLIMDALGCAPLRVTGPEVRRVRQILSMRAEANQLLAAA